MTDAELKELLLQWKAAGRPEPSDYEEQRKLALRQEDRIKELESKLTLAEPVKEAVSAYLAAVEHESQMDLESMKAVSGTSAELAAREAHRVSVKRAVAALNVMETAYRHALTGGTE